MLACRELQDTETHLAETHLVCVVLRPAPSPAGRLNIVADNTWPAAKGEDVRRLRAAARAFLRRVGS